MRQPQAQRFGSRVRVGDDTGELTTAAWRSAGLGEGIGEMGQRYLAVRKARVDGLNFTRIRPVFRQLREAAPAYV